MGLFKKKVVEPVKPKPILYPIGMEVEFIRRDRQIVRGTIVLYAMGIWSAARYIRDENDKAHFIHTTEIIGEATPKQENKENI